MKDEEIKKIKQILVEGQGWIDSGFVNDFYEQIEEFYVNGEMALVRWFRKGNKEFNGKYVIQINYED